MNTLAPVNIPQVRVAGVLWLITQVEFVVDLERGKVAQITLMPPSAFTLAPPVSPFDQQIMQAMQEAAMTAPASSASPAGLLGRV
jgi:prophage tail gpP-like protein